MELMAFEFATFVIRNPSYVTKNVRSLSKVRRAMLEYRALHDSCEYSGKTKNLQVHHIVPVSVAPELAHVQANMMVLERNAHLHVAHAGSWTVYVQNMKEIVQVARIQRTLAAAA